MAKDKITFPLRLVNESSEEIDWYVFHTGSKSKHQYILDAIAEKIAKDKANLKEKGLAYDEKANGS